MHRPSFARIVAISLGLLVAAGAPVPPGAWAVDADLGPSLRMSTGQKRAFETLSSPTSLVCKNVALDKVVEYLARLHRIEIQIDRKALEAEGIAADTPVTESLEGISLRSALRLLLRDLELNFVMQGGRVVVTSEVRAEEQFFDAAYPVGDLVGARAAAGTMRLDTIGLVTAIRNAIAPESWKGGESDGQGTIRAVPPGESQFLVVHQNGPTQQRVVDFLENVRYMVRSKGGRASAAAERGSPRFAAEAGIRRALDAPTDLEFTETPLPLAVRYLQEQHGVAIRIDRRALKELGESPDELSVTQSLKGVSLRRALDSLLREFDLTCVIHDEVLLITTPEDAWSRFLATRLHPVDDPPERRGESGLHRIADEALIETIASTIRPATWDSVGGPGTISIVRKDSARWLVVTQPQQVHDEIGGLLDDLRRAAAGRAAAGPDGSVATQAAGEKKTLEALKSPVEIDVTEKTLADVLRDLQGRCHVQIQADRKALDDVGIDMDAPITLHAAGVSLEAALRLLLRPLDLTFDVADGVLSITTAEEAESRLRVKVYPVTDLVSLRTGGEDVQWLVDLVTSSVCPITWDSVGGPGSIAGLSLGRERALVVAQTFAVHEDVARLLRDLRSAAADGSARLSGAARSPGTPEGEQKVCDALGSSTVIEFTETPLSDAIDYLKDLHHIEIQLDRKALDDVGIGADTPITCRIRDASLGAALRRLLRNLNLVYEVRDGLLLITTPEEAESHARVKVYPVTDLITRSGSDGPDFDSLIDAITSTIGPTTWDAVGGPGSIAPYSIGHTHVLVFSQTWAMHGQVARLLDHLRGAAGLTAAVKVPRPPSAEEKISRALREAVTLTADETPLADVIEQLGKQGKVQIALDGKALDDAGIGGDSPVSCDVRQAALASALDRVGGGLELAWLVEDETILVTTADEAQSRCVTEVYAVEWQMAGRVAPDVAPHDLEGLIDGITSSIEPDTWDASGGPGSIAALRVGRTDLLIVSQTYAVQQALAKAMGNKPYRPK
jgi:hypothetical protein